MSVIDVTEAMAFTQASLYGQRSLRFQEAMNGQATHLSELMHLSIIGILESRLTDMRDVLTFEDRAVNAPIYQGSA